MLDELFFSQIRKIIREEIDEAMKKKEGPPAEETYMSFQQVVELTGLSASSIEGLIRTGELKAYYPTERRRTFRKSDVLKLMSKEKEDHEESAKFVRTA